MSKNLPTPAGPFGAGDLIGSESALPTAYRPMEGGGGSDLRAIARRLGAAIWRYKWLALVIALTGGVLGAVLTPRMVKPQYAAQATLWVEGSDPAAERHGPIQTTKLLSATGWPELLRSFVLLDAVVDELRLYLQPYVAADSVAFASFEVDPTLQPGTYRYEVDRGGREFKLTTKDGTLVQRGAVGEAVGVPVGFRWVPTAEARRPGREIEFAVRSPREVSNQLREGIQAQIRERGNFLTLRLAGDDPVKIATTLNAVTARFVELARELKAAQSEELARLLGEQLQAAAGNLHESEASLQGFRVSTATLPSDRVILQAPGLQSTQGTVFSNFFHLKMERDQLRRDREALERALAQGSTGNLSATAFGVIPSVHTSSELMGALSEMTTKRAELRGLQNQFTDEYPVVQRLSQELRTLEDQVIPRLSAHLLADIATREADMDSRLASASGEMREIPERSIEERRLERSVAIASDLYTMLRGRYESARLAAVSAVPDVRVLDNASPSGRPVNESEQTRLFLMFLLGGLGLAVAVPVVLDRLDNRLRYPEQVTHDMGLPILGAVPHVASGNGKPRKLTRNETSTAVEAFREIRLNLAHAYGAAGPLLTTVTSPGTGDGKSFITANLALAFADLGHDTLLIDGDIRRGQMHRLMGAVRVPGLTDFLSGTASAEEIVQPTAYASLDLIAAGTRMHAGPELLGSSAMSGLIRDLRGRYSVILIDSPPLGAGVDPFLLSTLTGNALLVLRTGRTDREFAAAKLDLLDRLPIRLLGAVLNDVPASGAYRYYSYLPGYAAEGEEATTAEEARQLEGV